MFNPNDIFISIAGNTDRLLHLCFNLELYNSFSFRDSLYTNLVYNGEFDLNELFSINNLSCDSLVMLRENKALHGGALETINVSLKKFIESDKSIGVIHNFDFLFFYEEPFKMMITDLLKTGKSFFGWLGKKTHPVEKAVYETDCFVITKEFAKGLYPINPKKDKPIFYRSALHIDSGDPKGVEIMEEWFFRRLINVVMYEDIGQLNNRRYGGGMPQKYITIDQKKVMSALDQYCLSTQTTFEEYYNKDDVVMTSLKEYDFKYQCIHTHESPILKSLFRMYRYNTGYSENFKVIDRFIDEEVLLID